MNYMEAYEQAKDGIDVALRLNGGLLYTKWDKIHGRLLWKDPSGVDGELITLNSNTEDGWEVVKEKRIPLWGKRDTQCITNQDKIITVVTDDLREVLKEYFDWEAKHLKFDFTRTTYFQDHRKKFFGKELVPKDDDCKTYQRPKTLKYFIIEKGIGGLSNANSIMRNNPTIDKEEIAIIPEVDFKTYDIKNMTELK